MTCYPINSYTSLKCMTCMWEMEIQQATILLKVRTSPRLYSRRRSWEWRPNNLCKWWQERQASHWLHADWVEQREGGGVWRHCGGGSLVPLVARWGDALSHTFLCKRGSACGGSSRAGMLPAHYWTERRWVGRSYGTVFKPSTEQITFVYYKESRSRIKMTS